MRAIRSLPLAFRGVSMLVMALSISAAATASAETVVPEPFRLPAKLTMPEAVAMFRERGLDLLIADTAILSARADERTAGAITNPSISVGVGKSIGPVCVGAASGCSSVSFLAGAQDNALITDVLFGKRSARVRVAQLSVEVAKMDRLDAQRQLEMPVKQQFAQAALAKAALELAKEVQGTSVQTLSLVEIRYKAGAVSEADVAKVETAKLQAEQVVESAQQSLRDAKLGLAMLLGARTLVPEFDVDDTFLHHQVAENLDEGARDTLLREAFDRRPDLKSSELLKKRAEASISLGRRQRIPDLGVWAQYSQQGAGEGAISPPTVTLGLSMPLPLFYQNQGAILRGEADLRNQSLQRAKVETQVVNGVESSLNAYTFSRKKLQRMETSLLPRARRARELVGIQYDKGAASLLELLDAQRTLIAVNSEYLQNLTDYWTSVFEIEQAVGRELHR